MILTSGVFDGLHIGHVAYLQAAATLTGQSVYVAVAPDAYVRQVKGREPQWTETDRLRTVQALRCVRGAFLHGDTSVATVIIARAFPWTVFVKGSDWRGRLPADVVDACVQHRVAIQFVESGIAQHSHN